MAALFDVIVSHTSAPDVDADGPFSMLATTLEADPYLGRILTGRIESGTIVANGQVHALRTGSGRIESGRITKILAFRGLERQPVDQASAGDIVALAGLSEATVADTIAVTRSDGTAAFAAD